MPDNARVEAGRWQRVSKGESTSYGVALAHDREMVAGIVRHDVRGKPHAACWRTLDSLGANVIAVKTE